MVRALIHPIGAFPAPNWRIHLIWIKALGELGNMLKRLGLLRYESRLGLLERDDLHTRFPGLIGGQEHVLHR